MKLSKIRMGTLRESAKVAFHVGTNRLLAEVCGRIATLTEQRNEAAPIRTLGQHLGTKPSA